MTNHIEQLMKAAGVEPEKRFKECKENAKDTGLCTKYPCVKCESSVFIDKYPVFTPEKQLELIKLIVADCKDIKISKFQDIYTIGAIEDWGDYIHNSGDSTDFVEAIAKITYTLISFNELDKSEVKRILENDKNYS